MCSYNPSQPAIVYFDIGSAIAALGFLLAIQQLLRPIYEFRLLAYGIRLWHLALVVVVGFIFVFVAALLPNIPVPRDQIWSYPIFWELFGGILIAGAYGIAGYLMLRPAKLMNINFVSFVRSAANLLSEAKDEDRVHFARDLYQNISKLIHTANAWEVAERCSLQIIFEEREKAGEKKSHSGQVPISPFYLFAHRKMLERASFAASFLRIIGDETLCSTLVKECPWMVSSIIRKISDEKLHVAQAESFVQEVSRQAIENPDSIMSREIGYDGFGQAPMLSESLFSDHFILRNYRPFAKLRFRLSASISRDFIEKVAAASEMAMEVTLYEQEYWQCQHMWDVKNVYENISRKFGWSSSDEIPKDHPDLPWTSGISQLCKMLVENMNKLDEFRYKNLYKAKMEYRNWLVDTIAEIVVDSLEAIANKFDDVDSNFWHHAVEIYNKVFEPWSDDEPEGLNPLQQVIAIKFQKKLRENMKGYYPAITRVLLLVVGPYERNENREKRTADAIMRDILYFEMKKLPDLLAAKPDKFSGFLPKIVRYDEKANTLTRTFRLGEDKSTDLNLINPPEIDLFDEKNWALKNVRPN